MLQPISIRHYSNEERGTWPSDEERTAPWKLSPYSEHVWKVIGTNGNIEQIDFRIPTIDNTRLVDHTSLYRTVKEYVFWVRQHPESGLKTAQGHRVIANEIMALACALTHRRITSFAQIDRLLYQDLLDAWEYGNEGLLSGSQLVRDYLAQFKAFADIPSEFLLGGASTRTLARNKILAVCGLGPTKSAQIRWEFDTFMRRIGGFRLRGKIIERPPARKITSAVKSYRKAIFRNLHDYAPYMRAETISFRPITIGVGRRSNGTLKKSKRTKVVPPALMFKLLSYAADVVANHFAAAAKILGRHSENEAPSDGGKSISKGDEDNITRRVAVAVYLLIAIFTARRPEELQLLRRDCLEGNETDGWSINIFIVKNLNKWVWLPIPPLVAAAVKGLLSLQPEALPSDRLFAIPSVKFGRSVQLKARIALRKLARDANAIKYETRNGKTENWHWVPRQTRRFSAALFYWRYNGPVEVAQHILRHANITDTRGYVETDAELTSIWDEAGWDFARRLAETIADGSEQLGGPMGTRLSRMKNLIKHQLHKKLLIVDPDRTADGLEEVFRREMLVFIPKRWVICSCPATADAAAKAMCRKQEGLATSRQVGPDFQRAGPVPCASCYWGIQTSRNREFVTQEILDLKAAVVEPSRRGTVFGAIEEKNLARLVQAERKLGPDQRASAGGPQ